MVLTEYRKKAIARHKMCDEIQMNGKCFDFVFVFGLEWERFVFVFVFVCDGL